MFLPTTMKEIKELGWTGLDIILVTGDSYIDSPFIGAAVIGKVLVKAGYRVGIIAQPDTNEAHDITRLGEPELFWGVTGGCIDSMIANRTASGKKRKKDDYTPGGINNRRPDRATIVYSNFIRKNFKNTCPIVLGGIEASLRRVAHYDFWSNKIRRSILFDAKADYLLYGMAERSIVELANCLKAKEDPGKIRGLCYNSLEKPDNCIELPSFQESANDKPAFTRMFKLFYNNNDPITATTLAQKQDNRYLIQNPPALYLSEKELNAVYEMEYELDLHPFYRAHGSVKALETIRFSIASHRGCYGECRFCAIAVHQGRAIRWRSKQSIMAEAKKITLHPLFKGTIQDVGGPTANMYGIECSRKDKKGSCSEKSCLFPEICPELNVDHGKQLSLLKELRKINGIKKIVVASGIRHDMILADRKNGVAYLQELVRHHVSGQMKVAPEHCEDEVLEKMGKPGSKVLLKFKDLFYKLTAKAGKKQFLTYYMIAAHPGCAQSDMAKLKSFAMNELQIRPEQVQIFTPSPSTYSTLMYWTEQDPFTGKPCFAEKTERGRELQKKTLLGTPDKKRNKQQRKRRR
ncbi:YgiQ family radical SAM protein [Verrucomicrobiota bacterium]